MITTDRNCGLAEWINIQFFCEIHRTNIQSKFGMHSGNQMSLLLLFLSLSNEKQDWF